LIGLPYRLTVSQRTIENEQFELKPRTIKDTKLVTADAVIKILATS
jgi:prolyl-tRNA synthetase